MAVVDDRAEGRPRKQILLVDDEEALTWSLASRLAKVRPLDTIETASDGASALERIALVGVDLLIADVRMPGMSGIELILRARAQRPDLPVIIMTAFKSADVDEALLDPRTGYLEKPFEFERLVELVDHALSPKQVGFSGAILVQTLPDIVQLYVLSSATGALVVKHRGDLAELWFDRGTIPHARTQNAEGDEAVFEIMQWSGGEFTMRAGVTTTERSVRSSWQELLMESCRRIDELRQREEARPSRSGWTLVPPARDVEDDFDFGSTFTTEPLRAPPDFSQQPITSREEHVTSDHERHERESTMNIKDSLAKLNTMDGFVAAALVDSESGMLLGQEGGGPLNLEVAAAGNTEVVKSKRKTMANLGMKDNIEDILITLGKQYHLIRPLRSRSTLFFYVALDRQRANLAMARIALADVEKDLQV